VACKLRETNLDWPHCHSFHPSYYVHKRIRTYYFWVLCPHLLPLPCLILFLRPGFLMTPDPNIYIQAGFHVLHPGRSKADSPQCQPRLRRLSRPHQTAARSCNDRCPNMRARQLSSYALQSVMTWSRLLNIALVAVRPEDRSVRFICKKMPCPNLQTAFVLLKTSILRFGRIR